MKKAMLAVPAFMLVACAAQQPQPTADDDPSTKCFGAMPSDASLQVLARHIPLANPDLATMDMLADKATPTDEERQALRQWADLRRQCVQAGSAFRARYAPPGFIAVYEWHQSRLIQEIASLYAGTATFGQFNVNRQQISAQAREKLVTQDQLERRERDIREAEAAEAMHRAFRPLQPPPSSTVNCTSSHVGSATYTNCR